jgi:TetR/AcrR family transcriptional regulator, transcriptional repressor of bet genes
MPEQAAVQGAAQEKIAVALLAIVGSRGVDAASPAKVAADAGVPVREVRRYFSTGAQMVTFAFEHIGVRVAERAQRRLGGPRPGSWTRADLTALLLELLPLEDESRTEACAMAAFAARAATDQQIAAALREAQHRYLALLTKFVDTAVVVGELPADIHIAGTAMAIHALVEGLRCEILTGLLPPRVAVALLDTYLDLGLSQAAVLPPWPRPLPEG